MRELYLIGKISAVYNSEGFVTINSFTDFPERFFDLKTVSVKVFGKIKMLYIDEVEQVHNTVVLKFKNFDSDSDVKFLVGSEIFIEEENLIQLEEDEFFIHDLIGSKVFRNKQQLGIIEDVISLESNDVYVIKNKSGEEILIPAVKDYIGSFDEKDKILFLKSGEDDLYDED